MFCQYVCTLDQFLTQEKSNYMQNINLTCVKVTCLAALLEAPDILTPVFEPKQGRFYSAGSERA